MFYFYLLCLVISFIEPNLFEPMVLISIIATFFYLFIKINRIELLDEPIDVEDL